MAVEGTKKMCVSAYETATDPEFHDKVKTKLNKGVAVTKNFITGHKEEGENLQMRPEDNPYDASHHNEFNPNTQPHENHPHGPTGGVNHSAGHPVEKKSNDYGDAFSDKDLREF